MSRKLRALSLLMIPPMLCLTLTPTATGQTDAKPTPRVENADWNLSGNLIVITYDLSAPGDQAYRVVITLLREDDTNFRVIPVTVTGDVGVIEEPGKGKVVRWDYAKDVPEGLSGPGYYFGFEVNTAGEALPTAQTLSTTEIVLGLAFMGAVVVAGVLLLFKPSQE